MATYTGTMYVGGDEWNDTAKGYQIGGDDYCDANATISLPMTYETYEDCSINCTFYAATAPSSWRSDWHCYVELYVNGKQFGDYVDIDRSWFSAGSGASSRTFSITPADFLNAVSGSYWGPREIESGDSVTIKFVGMDSGFVDSSSRCVYLTSASFYSDDATLLTYTLSYDANGGSNAPGEVSKAPGSSGYASITVSSLSPIYYGYTFQGWATNPNGSVEYKSGSTINIAVDTTLYAVWKSNTYSVTYDDNGADSGTAPVDSTAYNSGATVTVAGPGSMAKEGYIFIGWNTAADGNGITYAQGMTFTITSAVTLYAIWVEGSKAYIFDGTAWQTAKPYIYDGTTWQAAKMCLFTTEWNT